MGSGTCNWAGVYHIATLELYGDITLRGIPGYPTRHAVTFPGSRGWQRDTRAVGSNFSSALMTTRSLLHHRRSLSALLRHQPQPPQSDRRPAPKQGQCFVQDELVDNQPYIDVHPLPECPLRASSAPPCCRCKLPRSLSRSWRGTWPFWVRAIGRLCNQLIRSALQVPFALCLVYQIRRGAPFEFLASAETL